MEMPTINPSSLSSLSSSWQWKQHFTIVADNITNNTPTTGGDPSFTIATHNITTDNETITGDPLPQVVPVTDEEFVSDEILQAFMDIFVLAMPVLCVLAVVFCVFNAAVFWKQRAADYAWYLVAVDLGDGVCSLLEFLNTLVFFMVPGDSYAYLLVKWYLAKYVAVSFRRAAVCLNAFASLERFLAIAFPLKSASRRVCSKPYIVIMTVFAISLGAHSYFALEFKVGEDGKGGWKLTYTDLRNSNVDSFTAWATIDSVIFAYSPLIIIMILNSLLLVVLRMHALALQKVQGGHHQHNHQHQRQRQEKKPKTVSGGDSSLSGDGDSSELIQNHHHHHHNDNSPATAEAATTRNSSSVVSCKTRAENTTTTTTTAAIPSSSSRNTRRDTQTTKMVIVFSTVFLAMALPRMLNSSARYVFPGYGPKGTESNLYNSLGLLAQITSHLTETALFWVSFIYSRQFRRAVFGLPVISSLCRRWLPKTSLPGTGTSSSDVTSSSKGTRSSSSLN